MHPRLASIFPPAVPAHVPPSLRETWQQVRDDFEGAGRAFTTAEVDAEAVRRFEAAHARTPDLFSEVER